jgi:hypothetical protein
MRKHIFILAMALVACTFLPTSILRAHADGFGITPPYVTNDSLTQTSHYEQKIILVRGTPDQDLTAKVTINVPGANSWISVDKGNEFNLAAGVQQMPIIVSVNVPNDAKLGRYRGNIQVVVSPLVGPAKGTVGVTIGAQIDVDLQVIDKKMVDFHVHRVTMTNTEEGHALWWMHFPGKILFNMTLENVGNITGHPYGVTFTYGEYLTSKVLETENNTNDLADVQPFETKTVTAEMPTYLPQGSYKVFYVINGRDDHNVIGQGNLDLSVLPPGTLTAYVGYGFWGLKWQEKAITFAVVLGGLGILWGLLWFVRGLFSSGRSGRRKGVDRVSAPPPAPPRR